MNAIATAREAILSQLEPIERQADGLRHRLAELEAEKAPLEAALAALDESKKPKAKAGRKATKPCAKKPDVEAVCQSLLSDNGSLSRDDLEALAKGKLSGELGFSLSGFGLRFKQCLESGDFVVSEAGIVTLTRTAGSGEPDSVVDKSLPASGS